MGPLRVASALVPYALASIAVVVASTIALATTVRAPAAQSGIPLATRQPSTTARAIPSVDARMAYWRPAADGAMELWVSDLDGDRRTRIGRQGKDSDIALTRWSPDGGAVAYTVSGTLLEMAWLDVTTSRVQIPTQLRTARWRIVSFEWSPDGKRIAATLRSDGGLGGESDVYVTETTSSALWERVTTLADAYAGPWIDNDRLFVESSSGAIMTLDLRTKELRPVTALPAVSPQLGRDGRVYFMGGSAVSADVSSQPVATGWVWSATLDGDDLRREITVEHSQARLFGMLADGRAVIGVPGGIYVASDSVVPLVFAGSGTVRRVVVSDDGRRVLGITDSRILRIDATRVPKVLQPGALPPAAAAATLLSGIREPDVWLARRGVVPTVLGLAVPATAPKDRLAFVLGHALWELQRDGSARALTTERGTLLGRPAWSPAGDRVAAMFVAAGEREPSVVVVSGTSARRWRLPTAAQGMAWSPDGKAITFWIPTGTRLDQWNTHSFDPATGRGGETVPGRAIWGGGGRIVLSDGEFQVTGGTATTTGLRVGQRIDLVTGSTRRTMTDARRLAASPLLSNVPDAARMPLITQVVPSADPEHVLVTLSRLGPTQLATTRTPAHVVIRVSDGEPIHVSTIALEAGPFDLAWSPLGHLIGWGTGETTADGTLVRRAVVTEPTTGRTVLRVPGRFAGWSADAAVAYVARDEGLFAYRIDAAADPVRVSSLGVIVSAAK